MASIYRITNCTTINSLCKLFSSTLTTNNLVKCSSNLNKSISVIISNRNFNTSPVRNDLMEFFDDKKNWGEMEVKSGRSWQKEELRIKSNTDLHKLWYILLKEHNMLLTMEQECNDQYKLFPSPERLDKVRDSMKNLEEVVRERNKAYHMLETGVDGERPKEVVVGQLGLNKLHKHTEHLIPKEFNTKWKEAHQFNPRGGAVSKFLLLYIEKLYNEKRKKRVRNRNHVMGLLKRFPNMDMEALKEQYPDVDIDKCIEDKKSRGHFVPK